MYSQLGGVGAGGNAALVDQFGLVWGGFDHCILFYRCAGEFGCRLVAVTMGLTLVGRCKDVLGSCV